MIQCEACGAATHAIKKHLTEDDCTISNIEEYKTLYPEAPIYSQELLDINASRKVSMAGSATAVKNGTVVDLNATQHKPITDLIGKDDQRLYTSKSVKAGKKEPIRVSVLGKSEYDYMIPEADNNHIWDIEMLKDILMGIDDLNTPVLVWGHSGTGKTRSLENIASLTNRPLIRVQHTVNTEESHIIGQWKVKDGNMEFELGPLPLAMKHGWVYLADEYDFAFPSVLSVYQPVMEGEPLLIKEADLDNRLIKPHKNFRFVATGNTNGAGDDTGLYAGTNIQNAANYSRFGITVEAKYLSQKEEILMLVKRGILIEEDATKVVEFGNLVREAFDKKEISATIGPRELINASKIGSRKSDLKAGMSLAFTNRMTPVDKEKVDKIAQRVFG